MKAIYSAICIMVVYAIAHLATGNSASAQEQNPIKQPLVQAQIVGGQEADPGEWPWQAIIFPGPFMCGGSLIHPEWIMTAAHCVHDERGNLMSPQNVSALLGEHDLGSVSGNEQNRSISQIIRHPNYASQTADNDIALLKLSAPALLGASVSTIQIVTSPIDDGLVAASSVAWVTGWGAIEEGRTTTNVLREVDVLFVANKSCNLAYGGDITENMICAGYAEGGKDACQGDSGGPLVVQSSNGWKQAGIVSWGYGCARPDKYGVYVRVSQYAAWISQQTGISIGPTSTPPPTATPIVTATPTPNIETPVPSPTPTATATATVPQEILRNGGLEKGSNSDWTEDSSTLGTSGGSIIYPASALAIAPHSGQYGAWLGGLSPEVSDLAQSVTLPENSTISLRFYYQIRSAETDCSSDVAYVRVNSNPLFRFDLCGSGKTNDWIASSVDLSNFAGQTVTVGFRLQNNEARVSSLFVDDVEIEVSPAGSAPTATAQPTTDPSAEPTTDPPDTPSAGPLKNGDFESGANGEWAEQSANFGGQGEIILSNIDLPEKIPAQSGLYAAWLGGAHNENSTLRQELVVPSGSPTLYYFTRVASSDVCGYDMASVSIDDAVNNGVVNNTVVATYELCRNTSVGEWVQQSISLNDYVGKRIMLEFKTVTDGSLVSSFFVDNISISTSQPTPAPTETVSPLETISLLAEPGAAGIRTSWTVAIDPRVASYRILRRLTQEFTEIATTSATIYHDLDDDKNDLATSAHYCYQVEALTNAAAVVATSNIACTAHGQLSLWVPDIVGAPMSDIRVPVNVVNAYNLRIRSADIWIDYDPNVLELNGVAKSKLAQGYSWSYTNEESSADRQRVRVFGVPEGLENPQAIYGDGPLFSLHFKVIGVDGNKSPLLLRHHINGTDGSSITIVTGTGEDTVAAIVSNGGETSIPLNLQDGFLAVQSAPLYFPGDADGNGAIDNEDIVQTLRYAVAEEAPSDQVLSATDLNGNHKIEAADAAMLAYYIENQQWPVPPSIPATSEPTPEPTPEPTVAPTPEPTLTPTATPIEPSGSTTIPTPKRATSDSRLATSISLTDAQFAPDTIATIAIIANNVHDFAGGDIIIVYEPTVFAEILTVAPGNEVHDFHLEYANNSPGKLTISLAGKQAINGDMTLATFTAQLAPGAPVGDHPVDLASVKLADSYGRDFITSFPNNSLELLDARTVIGTSGSEVYLPVVMKF